MVFRRGAAGKRRDANEGPIVDALRDLGCEIHYVSGLGLPDLLVRSPLGRWVPLEVKAVKGKLKPSQQAITWPVVRSVDEAIEAVF